MILQERSRTKHCKQPRLDNIDLTSANPVLEP